MRRAKKTVSRRGAFTLVEMIVVITVILILAALAAAFIPRVSNSTNLSRAIDQMEQWLLTAKMRAKRDSLATGIRFIQMPGDAAGTYSQFQFIQQPDPLSGSPGGATLQTASSGVVTFVNVDFTMGGTLPANQYLAQPGDYLELRDGGVYLIQSASANQITLSSSSYVTGLSIAAPGTTNYRILRQPRVLMGEAPLVLPNNFVVDFNAIPGTSIAGTTVQPGLAGPSNYVSSPSTFYDILFSPTGAVVGANAGSGKLYLFVHDITLSTPDLPDMSGIIAVQCRTGFIGAYSVAPGADPFAFAESGRESGL